MFGRLLRDTWLACCLACVGALCSPGCVSLQASIEALEAATPDATGPEEIDIQYLQSALREAEMAGTSQLKMPGDPLFGQKAVKRATDKLIQAKKVQGAAPGGLGRRASSRIQHDLTAPASTTSPTASRSAYKPTSPGRATRWRAARQSSHRSTSTRSATRAPRRTCGQGV